MLRPDLIIVSFQPYHVFCSTCLVGRLMRASTADVIRIYCSLVCRHTYCMPTSVFWFVYDNDIEYRKCSRYTPSLGKVA